MTYEKFHRKGTSRERQARALQLAEEFRQKVSAASAASAHADQVNEYNAHVMASRLWRRVIGTATRLDQDTTIYREAVSRHIEAAQLLQRHKPDQI